MYFSRLLTGTLSVLGLFGMTVVLLTGCGAGNDSSEGSSAAPAKDWEKHIAEETIYVEGLEREYTLLFLTDTHMVAADENASQQEAANVAERFPLFLNQEGVPSAKQFPAWIEYANEQAVDAVLLGGDIIDTPSAANLELLGEQLAQLEMPYLYVNGNHDWTFPWEYMTEAGRAMYLPLLAPFMDGNTAVHSLNLGEITIVGIDNSTNQVDAQVLPEYERILAEDKAVILVAHVPFMTQSVLGRAREVWSNPVVIGAGNYGGIYPNENSEKFVSLTTKENSPVELVLAGHVHFYDKDVINGEKDVTQVVGGPGFEGNAVLVRVKPKQ